MRKVAWVRVTTGPSGARAEAVGIRHRAPYVTTAIPLSLAARLAAEGVRVVVHQEEPVGEANIDG
jgi:hypothetical protein